MGYAPYWVWGNLNLHLDVVDIIAYFGVKAYGNGSLGNAHHWGTPQFKAFVNAAHQAGAKVVLTVTGFDTSTIRTILTNSTSKTNLINNLVNIVAQSNGDGVNIDFEGVPSDVRAQLVDFVRDLKSALATKISNPHVSLATPAVDWRKAFDYKALSQYADFLFIMGYDYHWPGGNPGPVSPLYSSDLWGKYSLSWTMNDYFNKVGAQNILSVILGLPLYGEDWPVKAQIIPAKAAAKATPVLWDVAMVESQQYSNHWDPESFTPYYTYTDGSTPHQVWYDNIKSLHAKAMLAKDNGLGGIGFWALGYAQQDDKLWQDIKTMVFEPIEQGYDNPPDTAMDAYIADDSTSMEDIKEVNHSDTSVDTEKDQGTTKDIQVHDTYNKPDKTITYDESQLSDQQTDSVIKHKDNGSTKQQDTSKELNAQMDTSAGLDQGLDNTHSSKGGGCTTSNTPSSNLWFLFLLLAFLWIRHGKSLNNRSN